jgi:hypothetical protein
MSILNSIYPEQSECEFKATNDYAGGKQNFNASTYKILGNF